MIEFEYGTMMGNVAAERLLLDYNLYDRNRPGIKGRDYAAVRLYSYYDRILRCNDRGGYAAVRLYLPCLLQDFIYSTTRRTQHSIPQHIIQLKPFSFPPYFLTNNNQPSLDIVEHTSLMKTHRPTWLQILWKMNRKRW